MISAAESFGCLSGTAITISTATNPQLLPFGFPLHPISHGCRLTRLYGDLTPRDAVGHLLVSGQEASRAKIQSSAIATTPPRSDLLLCLIAADLIATGQAQSLVDQSGLSRYEIAKRLNIADSLLSRSYNGQQGVPWLLLQRVAEVAGMRVVAKVEATQTPRA